MKELVNHFQQVHSAKIDIIHGTLRSKQVAAEAERRNLRLPVQAIDPTATIANHQERRRLDETDGLPRSVEIVVSIDSKCHPDEEQIRQRHPSGESRINISVGTGVDLGGKKNNMQPCVVFGSRILSSSKCLDMLEMLWPRALPKAVYGGLRNLQAVWSMFSRN